MREVYKDGYILHLVFKVRFVFCWILAFISDAAYAEDRTGAEILATCKASMEPPIRMTVSTNGVISLISRKQLPGNVSAIRMETMTAPGMIYISVGAQSFELFPEQRKAIESSILIQGARQDVSKLLSGDSATVDLPQEHEVTSVENADQDGSACWVLTVRMPSHILTRLASMRPEVLERFPAVQKVYVEKASGSLMKREMLSMDGHLIASSKYFDIHKDPEMSDELFLIPSTYTLLTPQCTEEFFSLHQSLFVGALPNRAIAGGIDASMIERPWEHLGIDQSAFYKSVERSIARERARLASGLPVAPVKPEVFFFGFFVNNCILSVVFVAMLCYLGWRGK